MQDQDLVREIGAPVLRSKGWLKLLGFLSVAYGVLMILTVAGIAIAWLPIWMGIVLVRAGKAIEQSASTGDKHQLLIALSSIRTFFTLSGVVALAGLLVACSSSLLWAPLIFSYLFEGWW